MPFAATCIDPEIIVLSEVNQTKATVICLHLCVESKNVIQTKLFAQQKQIHRYNKETYSYQK